MKRHCLAMAASVCALALAPSTALAGNQEGGAVEGLGKQAQTATNQNPTNQNPTNQNPTNQNTTEQSATSEAGSKQPSVNVPIAVDSPGSNNVDVNQSNEANAGASSEDSNNTEQSNQQSQQASATGSNDGECGSCGCHNSTSQSAASSASNKQSNVNEPNSKGSASNGTGQGRGGGQYDGGNGQSGHVNQPNDAITSASSESNNNTHRGNTQRQDGSTASHGRGDPGGRGSGGSDEGSRRGGERGPGGSTKGSRRGSGERGPGDGGRSVEQRQSGSNKARRSQSAEIPASNGQSSVTLPELILLRPFPVVRIAGSYTSSGVELSLLTVQAPVGARVMVMCRGRGCPAKSESRVAGSWEIRVAVSSGSKHMALMVLLAFRPFERYLQAGVTLEIRVWKPGEIGKYTRFAIRRGTVPSRVDTCLGPVDSQPMACPLP